MSITVSTKFFEKKKKNRKDQNSVSCTKNSLFWISTRNDHISWGCAKKNGNSRGKGGTFCEPILENPEGRGVIRKIPYVGGMDIFFLELHNASHINIEKYSAV